MRDLACESVLPRSRAVLAGFIAKLSSCNRFCLSVARSSGTDLSRGFQRSATQVSMAAMDIVDPSRCDVMPAVSQQLPPRLPVRSHVSTRDQTDEDNGRAITDSMNILLLHRGSARFLRCVLQAATAAAPPRMGRDDAWPGSAPKTVGALPLDWMMTWIVSHDAEASKNLKVMTVSFLTTLETKDTGIVAKLFRLFTGTSTSTRLPPPCLKSVGFTTMLFDHRAAGIGELMAGYRELKTFGSDGGGYLELLTSSPYTFVENGEGEAYMVDFMGMAKAKLPTVIGGDWTMLEPYSIRDCALKRGDKTIRLYDLFVNNKVPPRTIVGATKSKKNPLTALAAKIEAMVLGSRSTCARCQLQANVESIVLRAGRVARHEGVAAGSAATRATAAKRARRSLPPPGGASSSSARRPTPSS